MFTIYIITNGRSTFQYCLNAIKESKPPYPIFVIENMKWINALQKCIDDCKTPFFFRIDDDFIVHPKMISYMSLQSENKDFGVYYCHVWEDYTSRIRQSIKVYNVDALKSINGFHADPNTGKVDTTTNNILKKNGKKIIPDRSIVAIHACGTFDEHEEYQKLWDKMANRPWKKSTHKHIKKYKKSLKHQYNLRTDFLEKLNKDMKTDFSKYQ